VDRVAVLVVDHLAVLGVVDAALAEPDLVLLGGRERVVEAPLVNAQQLRLLVHRAERGAEAEALDVLLRLRDPEVRHHLLELVLAAVVAEAVCGRVGRITGLAQDRGPAAAKEAAAVEVGQRDAVIGGGRHGGRGVLLVGERLDAEVLDRVRREDESGARAAAGARLRGERDRHADRREQRNQAEGRDDATQDVPPLK
jgi:hypothetical protein